MHGQPTIKKTEDLVIDLVKTKNHIYKHTDHNKTDNVRIT